MRAQNNFKKGAVEMLLLHILKEQGDCYGYQFSKLIKELSNDYLTVPEGSLYPALYKLIEKGQKPAGKRMIRVYYHLESSGEERLAYLKNEFYETNRSIEKILDYDFPVES